MLIFVLGGLSACKNFSWPIPNEDQTKPATPSLVGSIMAPAYSPPQALYNAAQSVTITTPSPGATICYSTSAIQPDCNSASATCTSGTQYTTPVAVAANLMLKSLACKAGQNNSIITSGIYTIDSTPPGSATAFTATPGDTEIALAWTNPADADFAGVIILRKTGAYPANSSDGTLVYTGTGASAVDITLTNGTQYYYGIYAFDLAGNKATSAQATATPNGGAVNPPSLSPSAGIFNATQNVSLTTTTAGSIICYTTNGTNPACSATPTCISGSAYVSAVNITTTTNLKAIACKSGSTDSGITSGTYTIDAIAPVISAVAPASSSTTNSTQVSYTLSENCTSASVTWTRTGGAADSTVHAQPLTGSELPAGTHSNISLVNNPTLVEGAIYTISFGCTDAAGNAAVTVTSSAVTFDSAPPGNISSLRVIPGDTRTTLVWINPPDADLAGIRVVRKTGSYPLNNTDGTIVFDLIGATTLDTSLSNGTQYYYKVFARDTGGNFASGATATATPFSPCGGGVCRIFVATATFNGNLGGTAGADAKCNADAGKPNASTYKAILVDGASRIACTAANCAPATGVEQSLDWPLFPNKNYVRADGVTAVATSNTNALFLAPLTNSIGTGGSQIWVGLNTDWTTSVDTCNGWLDSTSGFSGARATANTTTNSAWSAGQNPCNVSRTLYCAEQ